MNDDLEMDILDVLEHSRWKELSAQVLAARVGCEVHEAFATLSSLEAQGYVVGRHAQLGFVWQITSSGRMWLDSVIEPDE